MTKSEICRSYKFSKYKNIQIGILADLNLCGEEQIKNILIEAGVFEKHTRKKSAGMGNAAYWKKRNQLAENPKKREVNLEMSEMSETGVDLKNEGVSEMSEVRNEKNRIDWDAVMKLHDEGKSCNEIHEITGYNRDSLRIGLNRRRKKTENIKMPENKSFDKETSPKETAPKETKKEADYTARVFNRAEKILLMFSASDSVAVKNAAQHLITALANEDISKHLGLNSEDGQTGSESK